MNAASATVMAINHGLTRGFHCAEDATSGFVIVVSLLAAAAGVRVFVSAKTIPLSLL
jgi:hypothetical protein